MAVLLLGLLAVLFPADSLDRNDCADLLPARSVSELPVRSFGDAQRVWAGREDVPTDTLRSYVSQLQEARRCFQRLPESILERPSREILYTLKWEGYLRAALSEFSGAVEAFDDAIDHLEEGTLPPEELQSIRASELPYLYQNRGYLHYLLGNLSDALDQYLKALQSTPDAKPSERVGLLASIGIVYQRVQDYPSARYYFDRAQRLFQESNLPDSSQLAYVLHNQGDLILEQTLNTKYDSIALERASKLARRSRVAADTGTEQYALASMALSESLGYLEEFEAAYRLNDEALQIARRHDDIRLQALVLLKRGVLHMQTEKWPSAETTLHRALSLARKLGDLDRQRRILRGLGRLHELQNDWGMAEEYYRRGVSVIEQYRESLTATQWSSTAFAQWRDVHRGLVRTLLAQDRPREALTALDRSRARHLQDVRTQAQVANELPDPERARLDSVSRALSDVRTQLGRDTLSAAVETDLRTREATLMAARQEILGPASTTTDRPSLDRIRASLGRQDRALVSYFLDDPWPVYDRSPRSAAFILTADTLRAVSLPELSHDSVRARVRDVSPLFSQTGKAKSVNAMHFDLRPLHTLHDRLYAPVAEYLPDERPLTVIPDGPMFHVPYSMLATALPGGRYDHGQARFVLHERPTTLDLATSMVADTSSPSDFELDVAAFGVSTFDANQSLPSALRATLSEAFPDSSFVLAPLPGVQAEMETLQGLFEDAKTYFNEAATESAFASACRRAGVLHLASHAFVHPSSPLQNAFLLRPDSTSDGLLFLHEVKAQDRTIPLAVLSGCSTARGTLRGGEGMAGLQYAFRAMGTQSTVSNLWPVADQPSVTLMEAFYNNLQAGLPKDRALRQAKLTYLEDHPSKASPFFWAPSVLYGSPQPVPLEENAFSSRWTWGVAALAFLAMLAALVLWRRPRARTSVRRFFVS